MLLARLARLRPSSSSSILSSPTPLCCGCARVPLLNGLPGVATVRSPAALRAAWQLRARACAPATCTGTGLCFPFSFEPTGTAWELTNALVLTPLRKGGRIPANQPHGPSPQPSVRWVAVGGQPCTYKPRRPPACPLLVSFVGTKRAGEAGGVLLFVSAACAVPCPCSARACNNIPFFYWSLFNRVDGKACFSFSVRGTSTVISPAPNPPAQEKGVRVTGAPRRAHAGLPVGFGGWSTLPSWAVRSLIRASTRICCCTAKAKAA